MGIRVVIHPISSLFAERKIKMSYEVKAIRTRLIRSARTTIVVGTIRPIEQV